MNLPCNADLFVKARKMPKTKSLLYRAAATNLRPEPNVCEGKCLVKHCQEEAYGHVKEYLRLSVSAGS